MRVRARHAWLPDGLASDVVVRVDGGAIAEVRPATAADPPAEPGLLVPGLVNAHVHLEFSYAAGRVAPGLGLPAWVRALLAVPRPPEPPSADPLARAGTALACDISGTGASAAALRAAGVHGVVQHEQLGFAPGDPPPPAPFAPPDRGVTVRDSPHAVYSTSPARIRQLARPGPAPASIHLAEDPAERRFTERGDGPFAELLDALRRDWRWWRPPGASPAAYLDQLGVLGPDLLLVHGVDLDDSDRRLVAARGAPLCLCPRSNLHVGGRLPDVPALLAAGVRLCLGTDSLGSSPSLDVLDEIPVLARAFPEVPLERWLALATAGGADALRAPGYGRIAAGARGGLVLLHLDDPRALLDGAPPRSWRVRP